jgi:hypothetical protein
VTPEGLETEGIASPRDDDDDDVAMRSSAARSLHLPPTLTPAGGAVDIHGPTESRAKAKRGVSLAFGGAAGSGRVGGAGQGRAEAQAEEAELAEESVAGRRPGMWPIEVGNWITSQRFLMWA